jgi:hypothetical protein
MNTQTQRTIAEIDADINRPEGYHALMGADGQ